MKKSLVLLAAFALTYPALWWGGRHFGEWAVFTPMGWALAALALLAFAPDRLRAFCDLSRDAVRQVVYCMIPAAIILLMHYYFSRGNTDLLCRGLYWFVLPLYGAVFARELRRPLLWTAAALAGADLFAFAVQFFRDLPPYGVTGNWNWSASLLSAGCFAAAGLVKRRGMRIAFLAAGLLSPAVFLLDRDWRPAFPFGTLAAACGAALFFALGKWKFRVAGAMVLGIAFFAGYVWAVQHSADLSRETLGEGAVRMTAAHPVCGVGPGRFESEIPAFLPERYFTGAFRAERHPHPHNQLLKFAGEFGLAGLALFAAYCLILYRAWRPAAQDKVPERAALWLLAVLLTLHGMADVLLDEWPLSMLWLLTLGVLWGGEVPERTVEVPETEKSDVRWPLRAVQILFAVLLAVQLARDGMSGYHARRAQLGGGPADWEASLAWKATPKNLYALAAHHLFDRKDPAAALRFLARIEPETLFRNYLHNQGLTAQALAVSGRFAEALPYFEAEQRNFPFRAANLYFHAMTLRRLGRIPEADAKLAVLKKVLETHTQPVGELPAPLRDPAFVSRLPDSGGMP